VDEASESESEVTEPEFKPYGKTQRFKGCGVCITEKIDGTNALMHITDDGRLYAGSRNRWLTPGKTSDNYGFAAWCLENEPELLKLGPGYHYGEWWGSGIGRGYGRTNIGGQPDRTLSLFNTLRWGIHNPNTPSCCSVVPVLYSGAFTGKEHTDAEAQLHLNGSVAQAQLMVERGWLHIPTFMRPEGLCMYFFMSDQTFKVVFDKTGPSPIESQ
jgi:hypothetical protein